ncbi:MAG: GNAT family N-acetyltransferase [Devosia sp.]
MSAHPLSNPVWNSLIGQHQHLGFLDGKVRRYRPEVAMFVSVEDPRDPDMPGLLDILGEGTAGFVTEGPITLPPGIETIRVADVQQMIAAVWTPVDVTLDMVPLAEADEPEMVALVDLTKPGPFAAKTRLMGNFRGLYEGERLVAMSGERWRTADFTEISAVCTRPESRGRGYAKQFVSQGGNEILADGRTPFLHTFADNALAIATYEKLGFRRSRMMQFTVIRRA